MGLREWIPAVAQATQRDLHHMRVASNYLSS